MEWEVTVFLLITPGALSACVTDDRIHSLESGVKVHSYIPIISFQVHLKSVTPCWNCAVDND